MLAVGISCVRDEVVALVSQDLIDLIIRNMERLTMIVRNSLTIMEREQGSVILALEGVTTKQAVPY